MSDHVWIAVAVGLAVGGVLGLGFFGALLLTVRALPQARHPGLLALASLLARLALVVGGLFLVVDGGIAALGAALVGMLAVRTVLVRRFGAPGPGREPGGDMDLTTLSPDEVVYWQVGAVELNATIVWTWAVMLLMVLGSWLVTRRLSTGAEVSRWQTLLEVTVSAVRSQIEEIAADRPDRYLPFVGTLFLFIAVANVLMLVPGYVPPTASLSTTTGLALAVFVAVPIFGIAGEGVRGYLRHYVEPTPLMLPFNLIGELSRTLALAMRLFGNVLSGTKVVAVLVAVAPLVFPILLRVLGLITGLVQAYIFAVLAIVYIASGERARRDTAEPHATADTTQGT